MNIIVTGASRGIGYELVKLLSIDSKNTVIAISRNASKLDQLKDECLLQNSSANVMPIVCDLSDKNAIEALVSELRKKISSVTILINNAGALVNKPFETILTTDLEYVYNVNVFSVVRLIQGIFPLLDQEQRSHIVNISSMGGFQGSAKFAGLSAYSSSKAALACLTECLAEEFKEKNVAFNCLALGATQTEMLNEAFPGYKAPLTAAKMAAFIADFSLNAQQYMNGKIIPVSLSTP
ncbi:MAG: SDR family oxidoreductase [Bacteroidetes bacterium]|nr:SDR family oxidoreductase [Bacteroidota bacterium]